MRGSFHWNCPISRSPVAFAAILFLTRSRRTFSPSSRIRSNYPHMPHPPCIIPAATQPQPNCYTTTSQPSYHAPTTLQPSFVSNPRFRHSHPTSLIRQLRQQSTATKPQPNDATRNGHKSVLQSPLRAKCSLIRGRFRSCAERLCLVCRIFNKRLLAWRIPKPPDFHPHHVVGLERGKGNMV